MFAQANAALGISATLGAAQSIGSQEARKPEVSAQIDSLSREASEIAAYVDSLEARFGRVLQQIPPEPKNAENVGGQCATAMGGELSAIVDNLLASRLRLSSILHRAEL